MSSGQYLLAIVDSGQYRLRVLPATRVHSGGLAVINNSDKIMGLGHFMTKEEEAYSFY